MSEPLQFPRRGPLGELEQVLDELGAADERTRELARAIARGEDVEIDVAAILDAELDARGVADPALRELAHAILRSAGY